MGIRLYIMTNKLNEKKSNKNLIYLETMISGSLLTGTKTTEVAGL